MSRGEKVLALAGGTVGGVAAFGLMFWLWLRDLERMSDRVSGPE